MQCPLFLCLPVTQKPLKWWILVEIPAMRNFKFIKSTAMKIIYMNKLRIYLNQDFSWTVIDENTSVNLSIIQKIDEWSKSYGLATSNYVQLNSTLIHLIRSMKCSSEGSWNDLAECLIKSHGAYENCRV